MPGRLAAALLALALLCQPIQADAQQRPMTVNEVIEYVERRHQGKVVDVQTRQTDRGTVYLVRVLSRDGRVRTVTVPANGR